MAEFRDGTVFKKKKMGKLGCLFPGLGNLGKMAFSAEILGKFENFMIIVNR